MKPIFLIIAIYVSACSKFTSQQKSLILETPPEDILSTRPIADLVDGWADMLQDIEANILSPAELQNKQYSLKLKLQGDWRLVISPREAFRVDSPENSIIKVRILSPNLLVDNVGGLKKMTYIEASLVKYSGTKGVAHISGKISCVFPVTFHQKNGEIINLEKLKTEYDLEYMISNQKAVQLKSEYRFQVLFERGDDNHDYSEVVLKLTNKKTHEVVLGDPIPFPSCAPKVTHGEGVRYLPLSPSDCLHHIENIGVKEMQGRNVSGNYSEHFFNSCTDKISCKLPVDYLYFKQGQLVFKENKVYEFELNSSSKTIVDTSWPFNGYVGSYDKTYYHSKLVPAYVLKNWGERLSSDEQVLSCSWK